MLTSSPCLKAGALRHVFGNDVRDAMNKWLATFMDGDRPALFDAVQFGWNHATRTLADKAGPCPICGNYFEHNDALAAKVAQLERELREARVEIARLMGMY